jgi:GT2 family glycosyltransferase
LDISIIIVSYNVLDYLQNCLKSIHDSKPQCTYEIIVVDNASNDQSREVILSTFPGVHWLQNSANIGFAAANNQAIQVSKGEYIWLLNPDTQVQPGALDALKQAADNDPRIAACGSKLINPDGTLQISCYPFPTLGNEFLRMFHLEKFSSRAHYPMDRWQTQTLYPVDNLQGASLLLRKSALNEVGVLDESFFVYTEEVDLNYRLKKAGWRNCWVPGSVVIHYGGQSTKQNRSAMFLELYKTKVQFFRKHYGRLKTGLYKFLLFLAALLRVIAGKLISLFSKSADNRVLLQNYALLIKHLPDY